MDVLTMVGRELMDKSKTQYHVAPIHLYTYNPSILRSQPNGRPSSFNATMQPNKHNRILFLARKRKQSNCATSHDRRPVGTNRLSYTTPRPTAKGSLFPRRRALNDEQPNNQALQESPGVQSRTVLVSPWALESNAERKERHGMEANLRSQQKKNITPKTGLPSSMCVCK
jgi:hypothetical protein